MNKKRILTLVLASIMLIIPCFNTNVEAKISGNDYWNMDKNNTELQARCNMVQVADNMAAFVCTLSSNPRVTQNMKGDFSEPLEDITYELFVDKPSSKIREVFIEATNKKNEKDNIFVSHNISGYTITEIDNSSKHLKYKLDKFGKASSKCISAFVDNPDDVDYNNDRISYLTAYYDTELEEEVKYHIIVKVGNTIVIDEENTAPVLQYEERERNQVIRGIQSTNGSPKDTKKGTATVETKDPNNLKEIKQKPAEKTDNTVEENTEETPEEQVEENTEEVVDNNEEKNTEENNEEELTAETTDDNKEKEIKEDKKENSDKKENKKAEKEETTEESSSNDKNTFIYIGLGVLALAAIIYLVASSKKKNSK